MTITVAETPRLANGAERRVYQLLVDQLQPNDLVIPGQRVTDHLKDHEVDFVVAIEGAGIVCLEVKGGEVWHDGETWRQKRRGHEHKIDPVRQAREACYALRDFIEKDPRWTQGRLRWDHVVVLPNTDLARRLRASRVPALEGHRPHRPPTSSAKLREILLAPGTRPATAQPAGHRPALNRVERQGITATQRGRPRARPTRTPPTRSPNTRPSSSTPSNC